MPSLKMILFHGRSNRTKYLIRNSTTSFFMRILETAVGFLLVPLMLRSLDQFTYGLWLTVFSFVTWFRFSEVGIAQGLRNNLSYAVAQGDYQYARILVSTAYFSMLAISTIISFIFIIIALHLDWYSIFNVDTGLVHDLPAVVILTYGVFAFSLSLKLVHTILHSLQQGYLVDILLLFDRLLVLITIFIVYKSSSSSLLTIAYIYNLIPFVVLLMTSIYVLFAKYSYLRPSVKLYSFNTLKIIWKLGISFFLIQLSGIVLHSTDNIIISHIFSPKDVVPYRLVFRYYSLVLTIGTALIYPLWSSFSDAFKKNDFAWIQKGLRKGVLVSYALVLMLLLLYFLRPFVFRVWVGPMDVPSSLPIVSLLYSAITLLAYPYVMYINSVGKVKLQSYMYLLGAAINIPLSIVLSRISWLGVSGILLATIVSSFYFFVAPFYCRYLIRRH